MIEIYQEIRIVMFWGPYEIFNVYIVRLLNSVFTLYIFMNSQKR